VSNSANLAHIYLASLIRIIACYVLLLTNVQHFDPVPYYNSVHTLGTMYPTSSRLNHVGIKYDVVNHFMTCKEIINGKEIRSLKLF
jgi:hypothetical protein